MRFPLIDQYMGTRLGIALSAIPPGKVWVGESARRLQAELSYGYIHGLWWVWLADGRSAISVPPGAAEGTPARLEEVQDVQAVFDAGLAARLREPVDQALQAAGLPPTDRVLFDQVFACNGHLLRPYPLSACRRLVDAAIPPAAGLRLPAHCFPDGVVFGVVLGGQVVSFAFAHRAGVMEEQVADVGVETAAAYRRRGYARAAVSALVGEFARRGGEARYGCSPENIASIATARSVGFVPYAQSMILSAPRGTVTSEGEE